jgi:hypothetical protein
MEQWTDGIMISESRNFLFNLVFRRQNGIGGVKGTIGMEIPCREVPEYLPRPGGVAGGIRI